MNPYFRKKNFVSAVEAMVNYIIWQDFRLYICFLARQRKCINIYVIMQLFWNLKKKMPRNCFSPLNLKYLCYFLLGQNNSNYIL